MRPEGCFWWVAGGLRPPATHQLIVNRYSLLHDPSAAKGLRATEKRASRGLLPPAW